MKCDHVMGRYMGTDFLVTESTLQDALDDAVADFEAFKANPQEGQDPAYFKHFENYTPIQHLKENAFLYNYCPDCGAKLKITE